MKANVIKLLAAVGLLLFAAAESEAKILIYKGTIRSKTGIVEIEPPVSSLFLLVDPDSKFIALIRFFRENGNRKLSVAPPTDVNFASPDLPRGKSATTISFAFAFVTDADNFNNGLFYLRGTNNTLRFNSLTSGDVASINFPRLFTGIGFQTSGESGPGDTFSEDRVALVYNEPRTIAANNAGQGIETAFANLVQELNAKGFEE